MRITIKRTAVRVMSVITAMCTVFSAAGCGIVPEKELLDFIACRPEGLEIVLTGRDPSAALCEVADYITEMRKVRHPYDEGLQGRKGIEY